MKKILVIPFLALIILNLNITNEPNNLTIQNSTFAQAPSGFELGLEFPEGGTSEGCVALCGGPGTDCMIEGQYPTSCAKGNE